MGPAELTVGVVGLVGLFKDDVDCFEYIQLGRNFGRDFQTSFLKFGIARLRLSRWGQALGLSDDITIKINHRKILDGLFTVAGVPADKIRTISSAVDKLDKVCCCESFTFVLNLTYLA